MPVIEMIIFFIVGVLILRTKQSIYVVGKEVMDPILDKKIKFSVGSFFIYFSFLMLIYNISKVMKFNFQKPFSVLLVVGVICMIVYIIKSIVDSSKRAKNNIR